jgi:GR25 family glycosyltransferase involved in LPS biosynthesis
MKIIFCVCHYTPLFQRKDSVLRQFKNNDISEFDLIEIYNKEDLTKNNLEKFDNLKLSEISLFLKHISIYEKYLDNRDYIVVLEDDFIIKNNIDINKNIEKLINEANNNGDWDLIFSGECCNLHYKNIENEKNLYRTNFSRGTCMYIININTTNKLIEIFNSEKKIIKPIDHWFNYILDKYNMISYWSEPTIVMQGSEINVFPSSLR